MIVLEMAKAPIGAKHFFLEGGGDAVEVVVVVVGVKALSAD